MNNLQTIPSEFEIATGLISLGMARGSGWGDNDGNYARAKDWLSESYSLNADAYAHCIQHITRYLRI